MIRELKRKGKSPTDIDHRHVKYLNNVFEADHGKLKRLVKPTLGFKAMKWKGPKIIQWMIFPPNAYATIKGFEVMRALKKTAGAKQSSSAASDFQDHVYEV